MSGVYGRAIWKLLSDGGYAVARRGTENAHFYRFSKPAASGFPSMVELFGTAPNFITELDGLEIVPVPMGGGRVEPLGHPARC